MTTAILLAVLVLACIYGGYAYVKKLRAGGGCCGPHEAAEKKVRVADRDKSHYPYTAVLRVDGMTCSNCVRRVENALNRLDGVWAEADLGAGDGADAHEAAAGGPGACGRGTGRGVQSAGD